MRYTLGMLKLVIYIVVGLLVLSFFGISLQHLVESPAAQTNFQYVTSLLEQAWDDLHAQLLDLMHLFYQP